MPQDLDLYGQLLDLLVLLPLLGVAVILALPGRLSKGVAIFWSLVQLALALVLYRGYLQYASAELTTTGFVFGHSYDWFSANFGYDIGFGVALDGISIYLVLLAALVFPVALFFSFQTIREQEKTYYSLMVLLMTGVYGAFVATDLVLFFVCFELGLIPVYYLMGIWGGHDRIYAASKFFVYTLVGSLALMAATLYLGFAAGPSVDKIFTSDWNALMAFVPELTTRQQFWLFWGFMLAFMVKIPIWPLNTWQPNAYSQAPTAGTVMLAGLLLKMGVYGLLRFVLPFFPEPALHYAPLFAGLGVVAVLYGGLIAAVQTDLKRLIAYSSFAHMGFVTLGIFSFTQEAMSGAVLQLFSHGITITALFILIGILHHQQKSLQLHSYQGIAKQMPVFTWLFIIATFASIGVPGLSGFVGEFLIMLGSFGSPALGTPWFSILAAAGVIVAAFYMLWMVRRVFFGPLLDQNSTLQDITGREVLMLLPFVLLFFYIGFHATPFLAEIERSTIPLVQYLMDVPANVATTAP